MNTRIVIIPTYNEIENIQAIIEKVLSLEPVFDLLIVDDGSPDGTAACVKTLQQAHPDRIHLLERKGKLGLGTAYIAGFKYALDKSYEYIFEMDADFSHSPQDLERLYAACNIIGADVAVGSRYVKGGRTENWPLDRHIYSKGGAFYTKLITWLPVNDPTAGFVCYKRKVLETINLDEIRFVGYAFQIEMKFTAIKHGFNVVEIPIIFTDRTRGESKMSAGIFKEIICKNTEYNSA